MPRKLLDEMKDLINNTSREESASPIIRQQLEQFDSLKINSNVLDGFSRLFRKAGLKADADLLRLHLAKRRNDLLIVAVAPYGKEKTVLQLGFNPTGWTEESETDYLREVVVNKGDYKIGRILPCLPPEAKIFKKAHVAKEKKALAA